MGAWLRTRSNAIIDNLIAITILAPVGVLYTRGVSGFTAVLLLTAGCAAAAVALWLRRRARTRRAVRVHAEPTDDLRLALSKLLAPHPLVLDDVHHFTRIRQTFRIHGQDGAFELEYEGTNVSKRPSYRLCEMVAGDSPMDLRDLDISACDPADGSPLAWSAVLDEPYRKIIEVRFRRPVLPGESFRLRWSCTWRGTFTRPRDYVFFLAGHRRRGVDRLRGELRLSRPPVFLEGVSYSGRHSTRRVVTSVSQPAAVAHGDGSCTVVWDIEGVRARSVPVIEFERTDHETARAQDQG